LRGSRDSGANLNINDSSAEFNTTFEKDNSTRLDGAKISAYSTSIFQHLRLDDGIDFKRIKKSLNPSKNRDQIFSSGEASGASGSFFFFSHDKRFIVKTMSNEEL